MIGERLMATWRTIRVWVSAFVAFVSCPCHLPLTLPVILSLTAGTVLGAWLADNTATIIVISTVMFASSVFVTWRWSVRPADMIEVKQE
jgi:mercuric ion transport protein